MELPTKTRQFRRVNNEFMYNLQAEMEKNPAGSYGALFVVAKGLSNKQEWKLNDKDSYSYEVLSGTHQGLHNFITMQGLASATGSKLK